jgi:hypothetical protein
MKLLNRCWDSFIEVFFDGEPEDFLYWLLGCFFLFSPALCVWLF